MGPRQIQNMSPWPYPDSAAAAGAAAAAAAGAAAPTASAAAASAVASIFTTTNAVVASEAAVPILLLRAHFDMPDSNLHSAGLCSIASVRGCLQNWYSGHCHSCLVLPCFFQIVNMRMEWQSRDDGHLNFGELKITTPTTRI